MHRLLLPILLALTIGACGDGDAVTTTAAPEETTSSTSLPGTTGSAPDTTTTAAAASTTTEASVTTGSSTTTSVSAGPLDLRSPAFEHEGDIPVEHTCDGADLSPPLAWGDNPPGTVSLALIVDDPDAGDWSHWVIFDIPPSATSLPEGVPGGAANEVLPDGSVQGINDFGVRRIADFDQVGWDGPCPPGTDPHRYRFRLFALDTMLGLGPGATSTDVSAALGDHVLARSSLAGFYPAAG